LVRGERTRDDLENATANKRRRRFHEKSSPSCLFCELVRLFGVGVFVTHVHVTVTAVPAMSTSVVSTAASTVHAAHVVVRLHCSAAVCILAP